jgi:tetratricopeptide (TPR) repeat protein
MRYPARMSDFLKAQSLFQQGKLDKAKAALQKILKQTPDHVDALKLLGYIAGAKLDYQSAAKYLGHALKLDPSSPECWYYRGAALQHLARHEEALASFNEALRLKPAIFQARHDAGLSLSALQRFGEAVINFDAAIALDPLSWKAYYNRGIALGYLKRYEDEIASYDKALSLNIDDAHILGNRGVALGQLGRHEEAIASFEQSLAIDESNPAVLCSYGAVLSDLARYDEMLVALDRALKLKPDFAKAHFNRAHPLLLRGDFAQGWQEYEWRLRTPEFSGGKRAYSGLAWNGREALQGKKILLHSEQGYGDTLQFCRYASLVASLGAEVTLEVQSPLVSTLRSLNGVRVIATGESRPDVDYHCSLMSLPAILKTELSSLPNSVPYLAADVDKVLSWQTRLGDKRRPRVGLVWNGGFRADRPELRAVNERRNIPLDQFVQLKCAGIDFFSLQKGEPAQSEIAARKAELWPENNLFNFVEELKDFGDTAALIANLDLVISVDTATAHLAGAMGKQVWILNRYDTCWRWLLERSDSPWYPTATLYRQPSMGNWDTVIKRVRADLLQLII